MRQIVYLTILATISHAHCFTSFIYCIPFRSIHLLPATGPAVLAEIRFTTGLVGLFWLRKERKELKGWRYLQETSNRAAELVKCCWILPISLRNSVIFFLAHRGTVVRMAGSAWIIFFPTGFEIWSSVRYGFARLYEIDRIDLLHILLSSAAVGL